MLRPYLPEPSTDKHLTDALARLDRGRAGWAQTSAQERIDQLTICLTGLELEAADWVSAACRQRQCPLGGAEEGEEWLTGPVALIRYIRLLIDALKAGGEPRLPGSHQRQGGQWVAEVFPAEPRERALMPGVSGEVWMTPGTPVARQKGSSGPAVCLVLGGGGVTSAAPIEALHQLFVEGRAVLLKLSEQDAAVGPFISRAFWKLIELNAFTIVYGGAEVGDRLARSPVIEAVHLTGSAQTAARLQAAGVALTSAAIGGVNPIIVAPGTWSDDEIRYQARQIATAVTAGGGASCAAAQVVLLPSGWPQRAQLVDAITDALGRLSCRPPAHPDGEAASQRLLAHYPQARTLGEGAGLPWLLIPDVPAHAQEPLLAAEQPLGAVGLVDVVAGSTEDFLASAVRLCATLPGDVCALILASASTLASNRSTIERAIADLPHGTVGLNIWPGVAMCLGVAPWGGARGSRRNGFLLDKPQKTVFRAPAHLRATPLWFADRPGIARMGPALARFAAEPRWRHVPRILLGSRAALWRRR